ncbi:hypothetical protein ACA910_007773 [Epithemia clementina (nom. ined.)]
MITRQFKTGGSRRRQPVACADNKSNGNLWLASSSSSIFMLVSMVLFATQSLALTTRLGANSGRGILPRQQAHPESRRHCNHILLLRQQQPQRIISNSCRGRSRAQVTTTCLSSSNSNNGAWQGEVVPEADGRIRGCTIQPANNDDSIPTEWILTIDGEQADLGRFSEAIYKKFMNEAKRQRFQGFRPGTVPSHLEPTYRAFAMDECARETVLEALQQNNIRPFDEARSAMFFSKFEIPPFPTASSKKKKSKTSKKRNNSNNNKAGSVLEEENVAEEEESNAVEPPPSWRSFETMKEAISGGWKPGQSFSFVATNVKGQRLPNTDAPQQTAGTVGGLTL